MKTHCTGTATPVRYPLTVQLRSTAVQPAPRREWRLAHSTCRQLAATAGRQGNVAGDGSSSGRSSGRGGSSSSSRQAGGAREPSGSRHSDQAKVESILAGAGLDPAELQRENPTMYSLLTVPLARVLAKVHTDRLTTKAWLLLHPAQLMARICFLAYDVGLKAEHIRTRYGQDIKCLYFDLDGAQQLLAWLRSQHISNSQLQIASISYPRLWATDVGAAQRSKQHVQQHLGVTDAQWGEAFLLQTTGFAARPEVLGSVVAWLEAEPLGCSRAEVTQLWCKTPRLFLLPAVTLQHNLQRLLSRCPLSRQQLRSFMRGHCSLLMCDPAGLLAKLDSLVAELPGLAAKLDRLLVLGGTALGLGTEVLLGKASCLLQYGFSKEQLTTIVTRNPMIPTCSWDGKLQPMLMTLEGVLGSRQAVVAAVSKAPQLLVSAMNTIRDNLRALQQLGLTEGEMQRLGARQPQLLVFKLGSAEFQAALRYFEAVLGRPPRQMLVQYPGYLKSSLRRIDYKVSFMDYKRDTHYKASLSWVTFSDENFCQHYKYSPAEFKAWEGQWLQSERAREYGLDKAQEPGVRRFQAARHEGRKAQVTARRKQRLTGADNKEPAA